METMRAGITEAMIGVEVEQERKLLRMPREVGVLRAAVREFERERGDPVQEMLVGQDSFIQALWLVGMAGLTEIQVHIERGMREGYAILVGN